MDDAVLDLGIWVDAFNGFWEALKAVDTGNKNILYAPIVEIG